MANRVNATPTEHAGIIKAESCNESDSTQHSPEVDSHMLNTDCSGGSKVSPKHNVEGNGDGKPVKPGKDAVAVKSGSSAKSADNEVFIPAPPPATNAWTKRMQASCSAAKPAGESVNVRDKHGAARSPSDSKKSTSARKQSPTHTPPDQSAESDSQTSQLKSGGSEQPESTSSAAVGSGKQTSGEITENPPSSKQMVEVRPKPGSSEASSKAEAQVKSTSSASDTAPGGCWKIPVQSGCETSVIEGSSTSKRQSAELSTGELSLCVVV